MYSLQRAGSELTHSPAYPIIIIANHSSAREGAGIRSEKERT